LNIDFTLIGSKEEENVFSSLLFEIENTCLINYATIFSSVGGYMFLAIAVENLNMKYSFCYFVIVLMPN